MKFNYLIVPMLAAISFGTLHAQSADTTPAPTPGQEEFGHHGGGFHRRGGWIWRKLNLTDAQRAQVKTIRQGFKGQMRPAMLALLKAKQQLSRDIDTNGQSSAVTNDSTALANAIVQVETVKNMQWNQIKSILNPDQVTMLNDFKQKREEHVQKMIDRLSQPTS